MRRSRGKDQKTPKSFCSGVYYGETTDKQIAEAGIEAKIGATELGLEKALRNFFKHANDRRKAT